MRTLLFAGLGLLALLPAQVLTQSGTCSKDSKCVSGCCSKEGFCGFGPDFCDDDVCISDCDAVAECGEYAPDGKEFCPLNVCCSKFGFCGTTDEFCGADCKNGCDAVNRPSCSGTSSDKKYIGYYESWSPNKPCDVVKPSDINVKPWTHLYYSFALIDPSTSKITTMNSWDEEFYKEFTALKKRKAGLKTYISVGGWDAGGAVFSAMVRFPGTRNAFIQSALDLMDKYDFDGIDIDWEYPAAEDRDGVAADTKNFVTFMKALYEACDGKYGVTVTLPASFWYLQGFDIKGMIPYVDSFNLMTYDIHGTWDGQSQWTDSVVNPHTNLTEISAGLDLLWRNDIDPAKVILGLAFYGRSFTLKDPSCNTPGCPFNNATGLGGEATGGANPGMCSGTSGILTNYEISRILDDPAPEVVHDEEAGVNWINWDSDQWISYDDARTLIQKRDLANSRCLGGTLAWALDQGGPGTLKAPGDLDPSDGMKGASADGSDSGSGDVYIGSEIFEGTNTVRCVPPCNLIFPPKSLPSDTTYTFPSYRTSLEMAWPTMGTSTLSNGQVTVFSTYTRTITETTVSVPSVVTNKIDFWNKNITAPIDSATFTLTKSVLIPPLMITKSPSGSRIITLPPWPWTTPTQSPSDNLPTLTFTQGSPSPTCTSNCGRKCRIFCAGVCERDCDDGGDDFYDPEDPDPPTKPGCRGEDCHNGECDGPLCIYVGCEGDECEDNICTGDDCSVAACAGDDCEPTGRCKGTKCITSGCVGPHCGGGGSCFGLNCLSFGCIGLGCNTSTHTCSGPHCKVVTCSGPNCSYGVCHGKGCKDGGSEDGKDCENEQKAPQCTEYVKSSMAKPANTLTTTTSTHCETITACSATASTSTTTIKSGGATATQTEGLFRPKNTGKAVWDAAKSTILSRRASYDGTVIGTTKTTTKATSTTSKPVPTNGSKWVSFFVAEIVVGTTWLRNWEVYPSIGGVEFQPCDMDAIGTKKANTIGSNPDYPDVDITFSGKAHGVSGCEYKNAGSDKIGTLTCPGVSNIICVAENVDEKHLACTAGTLNHVFGCWW